MSIENLKSHDPFADEGDPFAETPDPTKTAETPDPAKTADLGSTLDPIPHKRKTADDGSFGSFQFEDPLAETADVGSTLDHIHIRLQQRNGRKTLTTLQGLSTDYDTKKILKAFKKEFACNGTLIDDAKAGKIVQLQGDQRAKIQNFLIEKGMPKETIRVHGF